VSRYPAASRAAGDTLIEIRIGSVDEAPFELRPEHEIDGLIRLELWILPDNEPSFRAAERAGFQHEGLLRSRLPFGGEFRDVVSYSLLRSDPR